MARKTNIIEVMETENNRFAVTYETGTVKQYTGDKLPKTVVAWIEAHKAEEPTDSTPETTKAAETAAEVESEEVTTEEARTAENVAEREENTMKKSGTYERELLKMVRNRERREKLTGGIFWNLETVVLILSGLMLTAAAAIVYGLAVAASWAAANVPTMISTAQKATQKAIETARTAAEVVTDTFKAFSHIGRKAATVAATIITMITR